MSRSLRPTRQALVIGLIILMLILSWQVYLGWQEHLGWQQRFDQGAPLLPGNVSGDTIHSDAQTLLSSQSGSSGWIADYRLMVIMLVLLILIADLVLSWRYPLVTLERRVSRSLALDQWITIELSATSSIPRPVTIELMDYVPVACDYQQLPVLLTLFQGQTQLSYYRCCPRRRGPLSLAHCAVRARSLLGLWQLTVVQQLTSEARVYPDFASVEGYQLLAADQQTSQLGIKRKPRRGEGMDFHQLREYRPGDALRQVDWNATARQQRLISREYQDERDQQVILMLDCGRRMLAQDGVATHFDHCLNALLMLTYIALRQGDAVAMMSFGAALRHTSPIKGATNISQMINQFYDLYPDKSAPDYLQAAEALISRYRKRSLIVFATNLRDEDTEDFVSACRLLQRHHLVMVANLREDALDKVLSHPVDDFKRALRYAGTLNYLHQRDKVQRLLMAQGLYLIDSLPQQLTPHLINRYFSIKRSGVW